MEILFTSIAALGLLILLVVVLHRYQLSAAQSQLDRNVPLPPIGERVAQKRNPDTEAQVEKPAAEAPAIESPGDELPSAEPPSPSQDKTPDYPQTGTSWLEQVAALKREQRTEEALAICLAALPLWSAFHQASLLLRARIKMAQSAASPLETDLKKLYQLAAVAALLHDKVKGLPSLNAAQLKQVDVQQLLNLPMPYEQLGYLQLRLIKKSDVRLMLDAWGKPESHLSPRQYHEKLWLELVYDQTTQKSAAA